MREHKHWDGKWPHVLSGKEWVKGRQLSDIAYDDLVTAVQQSGFQQRWKKMAVGLEVEITKLQREGVFPDLRTTTYEKVRGFIAKTKPQLLDITYHDRMLRSAGHTLRRWGSNVSRGFATVATDNINFLRVVDPDDFIASTVWRSFMIDFFHCRYLRADVGGASAHLRQCR